MNSATGIFAIDFNCCPCRNHFIYRIIKDFKDSSCGLPILIQSFRRISLLEIIKDLHLSGIEVVYRTVYNIFRNTEIRFCNSTCHCSNCVAVSAD